MSSCLRNDVRACLRSLAHEDGGEEDKFIAKFAFPEEFSGFRGHFQGMPVLPAICQVQCVLVALEGYLGGEAVLMRVGRGKFLNVVGAGEVLELGISVSRDGDFARASARISKIAPSGGKMAVARLEMLCKSRA
ncbi:MAG: hypothetical protein JW808_07230 [Victivallales bacterium]|nr:hypothetical protein [Victivallales bacterium]